jgi:hypothetical protein
MAMSGMMDNFGSQEIGNTGRYEAVAPTAGSIGDVSGAASYSGTGFQTMVSDNMKRGIEHNGSSFVMGEWTSNPAGGSFGLGDAGYLAGKHTADAVGMAPPKENPDMNYVQNTGQGGATFFKPSSPPKGANARQPLDIKDVETLIKR